MVGGAWPFLVGGVICLLNCVNERDLNLLNSDANPLAQRRKRRGPPLGAPPSGGLVGFVAHFLEGLLVSSQWKFEAITGL